MYKRNPERRDKLVIMTEIICVALKGASKTQIMYKANLSFSSLKRYLTFLSRHSLLKKTGQAGREIYKATPKGIEFMEIQLHLINYITDGLPRKNPEPYCPTTIIKSWPPLFHEQRKSAHSKMASNPNTE